MGSTAGQVEAPLRTPRPSGSACTRGLTFANVSTRSSAAARRHCQGSGRCPWPRSARGCAPLAALPPSSQRLLVRIDGLTSGSDLHEGVVQEPHLLDSLELPGFVARGLRPCLVGHLLDVDCPEELLLRVAGKRRRRRCPRAPAAASKGSSSRRRCPRAPAGVDPWPTVGTPSLGEPRGKRRSADFRLVAAAVEDVHELLLA